MVIDVLLQLPEVTLRGLAGSISRRPAGDEFGEELNLSRLQTFFFLGDVDQGVPY